MKYYNNLFYILLIPLVLAGLTGRAGLAMAEVDLNNLRAEINGLASQIESSNTPKRGTGSNNVNIQNNVSASASTGGNHAAGGQVVEGKAESTVSAKTVINGQTVNDTDITDSSGGNASAVINQHITADNNTASITAEIEMNGEKNTEEKKVDLKTGNIETVAPAFVPAAAKTTDTEATESIADAYVAATATSGEPVIRDSQESEAVCSATETSTCQSDIASNITTTTDQAGTVGNTNAFLSVWLAIVDTIKQGINKLFSIFA